MVTSVACVIVVVKRLKSDAVYKAFWEAWKELPGRKLLLMAYPEHRVECQYYPSKEFCVCN